MHVFCALDYAPGFAGGVVQHLAALGEELRRRGPSLTAAFPRPCLWFENLEPHAEILVLPEIQRPLRSGFASRVARLCRERGVDVLHLHFSFALPFALACRFPNRFPPVVYHWHNPPKALHLLRDTEAPPSRLGVAISGHLARFTDRRVIASHIAISAEIEDLLVGHRWTRAEKVLRLPNALARVPEIGKRDSARGDGIVIGSVANFRTQKDHETLLRAFQRFSRNHPGRLVLVGDGPTRTDMERLAGVLGIAARVEFTGMVPDPDPYYRGWDVFVLSTHSEGQGLVVLEAMAYGLPVVATDIPPTRAMIDTGVDGVLVPPRSPEALGDAFALLSGDADLRRRLGEAGAVMVRERWRIETWVDRVVDLYTDLCHGRPRGRRAPSAVP